MYDLSGIFGRAACDCQYQGSGLLAGKSYYAVRSNEELILEFPKSRTKTIINLINEAITLGAQEISYLC